MTVGKTEIAPGRRAPAGKRETAVAPGAAGFEPFINKTEVAKRLGRGVRTVEFWMQQGLLPYYKIKQSVSFKWSEVEQHLRESCRVTGLNG